MRVFVAGATGVIGWRATRELVAAGHEVTAMARTEAKAARLRQLGASPVLADLWDGDGLTAAVAGHDVVCNLATSIPPLSRAALPGAWADNDRIRALGSANLVDAALAAGAGRYVQESIVFIYADGGDRWLDETATVDPPHKASSVLSAEAQAARFTSAGGVGVVLRFGQFYSSDSSHCRTMVKAVRRRLAPTFGPKGAYMSSIHADYAARAVVAGLALPSGVTNVADDEPLTREDYAKAVAVAAGARTPHQLPLVSRLAEWQMDSLTRSQRVANGRLRAAGWTPLWPRAREGWPAVAAELLAAG